MIHQAYLLSVVHRGPTPASKFPEFDAASYRAAAPHEAQRPRRMLSIVRLVNDAVAAITQRPTAVPCCVTK